MYLNTVRAKMKFRFVRLKILQEVFKVRYLQKAVSFQSLRLQLKIFKNKNGEPEFISAEHEDELV